MGLGLFRGGGWGGWGRGRGRHGGGAGRLIGNGLGWGRDGGLERAGGWTARGCRSGMILSVVRSFRRRGGSRRTGNWPSDIKRSEERFSNLSSRDQKGGREGWRGGEKNVYLYLPRLASGTSSASFLMVPSSYNSSRVRFQYRFSPAAAAAHIRIDLVCTCVSWGKHLERSSYRKKRRRNHGEI